MTSSPTWRNCIELSGVNSCSTLKGARRAPSRGTYTAAGLCAARSCLQRSSHGKLPQRTLALLPCQQRMLSPHGLLLRVAAAVSLSGGRATLNQGARSGGTCPCHDLFMLTAASQCLLRFGGPPQQSLTQIRGLCGRSRDLEPHFAQTVRAQWACAPQTHLEGCSKSFFTWQMCSLFGAL